MSMPYVIKVGVRGPSILKPASKAVSQHRGQLLVRHFVRVGLERVVIALLLDRPITSQIN